MAAPRGKSPKATEMAQKPARKGAARNEALQVLASKGVYREIADEKASRGVNRLGRPVLTGRVYDLGGSVEAVLMAPFAVVDGITIFRGDVVHVTEEFLSKRTRFRRLAT